MGTTAAEKKMKKGAAKKAIKRNVAAKKIDPFVASFLLNGKEIQEQKPYKNRESIDDERELLAELNDVPIEKITESSPRKSTKKKPPWKSKKCGPRSPSGAK